VYKYLYENISSGHDDNHNNVHTNNDDMRSLTAMLSHILTGNFDSEGYAF